MTRIAREAARFGVIGGSGFVLGAVCLELLTRLGVSPYVAQVPTLAVCVTFTWACNRRWTFRALGAPSWREYGRYVVASAGGLAVNAACFSALSFLGLQATIAFAGATLAAMAFNFAGYKYGVFKSS